MAEFDIGDVVEIRRTVAIIRTVTDVSSHGGGTDYEFDRPMPPPGGMVVETHTRKMVSTRKKRRRT